MIVPLALTRNLPVGSNVDYVDEILRRGERIMLDLRDPVTGNDVIASFYASL